MTLGFPSRCQQLGLLVVVLLGSECTAHLFKRLVPWTTRAQSVVGIGSTSGKRSKAELLSLVERSVDQDVHHQHDKWMFLVRGGGPGKSGSHSSSRHESSSRSMPQRKGRKKSSSARRRRRRRADAKSSLNPKKRNRKSSISHSHSHSRGWYHADMPGGSDDDEANSKVEREDETDNNEIIPARRKSSGRSAEILSTESKKTRMRKKTNPRPAFLGDANRYLNASPSDGGKEPGALKHSSNKAKVKGVKSRPSLASSSKKRRKKRKGKVAPKELTSRKATARDEPPGEDHVLDGNTEHSSLHRKETHSVTTTRSDSRKTKKRKRKAKGIKKVSTFPEDSPLSSSSRVSNENGKASVAADDKEDTQISARSHELGKTRRKKKKKRKSPSTATTTTESFANEQNKEGTPSPVDNDSEPTQASELMTVGNLRGVSKDDPSITDGSNAVSPLEKDCADVTFTEGAETHPATWSTGSNDEGVAVQEGKTDVIDHVGLETTVDASSANSEEQRQSTDTTETVDEEDSGVSTTSPAPGITVIEDDTAETNYPDEHVEEIDENQNQDDAPSDELKGDAISTSKEETKEVVDGFHDDAPESADVVQALAELVDNTALKKDASQNNLPDNDIQQQQQGDEAQDWDQKGDGEQEEDVDDALEVEKDENEQNALAGRVDRVDSNTNTEETQELESVEASDASEGADAKEMEVDEQEEEDDDMDVPIKIDGVNVTIHINKHEEVSVHLNRANFDTSSQGMLHDVKDPGSDPCSPELSRNGYNGNDVEPDVDRREERADGFKTSRHKDGHSVMENELSHSASGNLPEGMHGDSPRNQLHPTEGGEPAVTDEGPSPTITDERCSQESGEDEPDEDEAGEGSEPDDGDVNERKERGPNLSFHGGSLPDDSKSDFHATEIQVSGVSGIGSPPPLGRYPPNDAESNSIIFDSPSLASDLKISVVTWNLAESSPSEDEARFLRQFRGDDLVLISGQECENIKPRRSEGHRSREFRRLMIKMLGKQYVPLALHLLGGIQFGLFCKRSILNKIEFVGIADVTCGIGNVFHNKGAIGAFVRVKAANVPNTGGSRQTRAKSLKMLFVTAHMAAHVKNSEARDADFWRIIQELEAQAPPDFLPPNPKKDIDVSASAQANSGGDGSYLLDSMDRVFFCGDLNYRIDVPREEAEHTVELIKKNPSEADKIRERLLRHDQLLATMAERNAFTGLSEGKITFLPTFKFDKGTEEYDTSHKQRIPAWTDRVVFKPAGTRILKYDSVQEAMHSDHRPVFASFQVSTVGSVIPSSRRRKRGKRRNSSISDVE